MEENCIIVRDKARLVAQRYNQQKGIDYEETFSPLARLESIGMLFAQIEPKFFCLLEKLHFISNRCEK